MRAASTSAAGLALANPPPGLRKLLSDQRTAIVAAQTKCVSPRKTRSEYEAKLDEVRAEITGIEAHLDPCNDALVEKLQARKTQLRLIEDSIVALDGEVADGERGQRDALGKAANAIRPTLGAEHSTILGEVAKAVRPWCHNDGEAQMFARQLYAIGDYELWCGMPWVGTLPLEQATEKMFAIFDTLADGRNPFIFANGL